jgi:hypothetical protein
MAKLEDDARLKLITPVGILKKFSIGIFNNFQFHNSCWDAEELIKNLMEKEKVSKKNADDNLLSSPE